MGLSGGVTRTATEKHGGRATAAVSPADTPESMPLIASHFNNVIKMILISLGS